MPLCCAAADREPGWLCAHYSSGGGEREREREGEGERERGGAAGWLPRPAGSPGPHTALMRAGRADGRTRGARDYCPGPRGARERREREETPAWTPAADLCSCTHSACMCKIWQLCFVFLMEYLSRPACSHMCVLYVTCMSTMHDVCLSVTDFRSLFISVALQIPKSSMASQHMQTMLIFFFFFVRMISSHIPAFACRDQHNYS